MPVKAGAAWQQAARLPALMRGSAWGGVSLASLAIGGLVLNVCIGRIYGPSGLGVFTQVMSIFILAAQFGTFGIQLSVLQWSALLQARSYRAGQVLHAALVGVILPATLCAVLLAVLAKPLGNLFHSTQMGLGILASSPGIIFFSLNKVFVNYLNGRNRLRSVSLLHSLRFFLLVGLVVIFAVMGQPVWMSGTALVCSEGILLIVLFIMFGKEIRSSRQPFFGYYVKKHLWFGRRSFIGAAVSQVNTKVDVLVLGLFFDDNMVGVYSIAALVAEGIMHVGHALRLAFNPVFAPAIRDPNKAVVLHHLRQMRRIGYYVMVAGSVLGLIGFAILIYILGQHDVFSRGWLPLIILTGGIVVVGGYIPLDMLLSQAVRPAEQTVLRLVTVCLNIVLNFILVPFFALNGAAVATSTSLIGGILFLKYSIWKQFGFKI